MQMTMFYDVGTVTQELS